MVTAGKLALQHDAPLTWRSRDAPLRAGGHSAMGWRERAAAHRAALGLHTPRRRYTTHDELTRDTNVPASETTAELSQASARIVATPTAPPRFEGDQDPDGEWWGSAMRVDLARYLRTRNALLSREAQLKGAVDPRLEHTAVWGVVQEALVFERTILRRRHPLANWPDALRAIETLSVEELNDLRERVSSGWWPWRLQHLPAMNARGQRYTLCR